MFIINKFQPLGKWDFNLKFLHDIERFIKEASMERRVIVSITPNLEYALFGFREGLNA
jgi:hypothetical protein